MLVVLIFALHSLTALKLSNPQSNILLLPQTPSALAPFTLQSENESERSVSYKLQVRCSDSLRSIVSFSNASNDICATGDATDTIENLNQLLQRANATLVQDAKAVKDANVLYTLHYAEDGSKTIAFQQTFAVATEVPVHIINKTIYFQPGSSTAFDLKVLTVQNEYLRSEPHPQLAMVVTSGHMPEWLTAQFENGELYFAGRTPTELQDDYKFSFAVQDKTTGLVSNDMEITLAGSLDGQAPNSKALVIVLFLIFTGIVACILLLIFMFSRKNAPNGDTLKHDVAAQVAQQQDKVDSSANVLSDSILNWNKKLIEKHQTRHFSTTDVDEEANAPGRSPGFAYECFDETFALTEDDRGQDIKISDRLSDIRHDDANRSSFLDDLRF